MRGVLTGPQCFSLHPVCVFSTGAFMLLYVILLVVIGVPLFFMELAAGQCIRQGSIGVWKHISPKLSGIGYSSCVVRPQTLSSALWGSSVL